MSLHVQPVENRDQHRDYQLHDCRTHVSEKQPAKRHSTGFRARKVLRKCSMVDMRGRRQLDVSGVVIVGWPTHFRYQELSSQKVRYVVCVMPIDIDLGFNSFFQ